MSAEISRTGAGAGAAVVGADRRGFGAGLSWSAGFEVGRAGGFWAAAGTAGASDTASDTTRSTTRESNRCDDTCMNRDLLIDAGPMGRPSLVMALNARVYQPSVR
jgi:hypothetical protein